jgi:hypothetical protein
VAVIILQIDQDVPIRVTIQTQVTSYYIVSHEQVIRYAGYTYQENGEPSNTWQMRVPPFFFDCLSPVDTPQIKFR